MIKLIHRSRIFSAGLVFIAILLVATTVILTSKITFAASDKQSEEGRLITIYDRGSKKTVLSQAETVGDVLKETGIKVNDQDLVEPEQKEKLVASSYKINIYRARPVIIVDGNIRLKIVTPYQTAEQIAKSAGITIYPEDETTIDRVDNLVEGAGLQLTIKRATPITFVLYGKTTTLRTRATTVSGMLKEKGIKLAADDTLSVPVSQVISSDETIELWRNGKQTINVDEDVPFAIRQTQAVYQMIGYKQIQTPGVLGKKITTYEVEMKNGVEVSRTEIQSIVLTQPIEQVEIIGFKSNGNDLTKNKGVNYYTDSRNIQHRETYYNLNMSGVMKNCQQNGYTVRADGVKVDAQGYILIAADLGRYPRCSVVETSLGLGMVYDTGAFVASYPNGFDIATDW